MRAVFAVVILGSVAAASAAAVPAGTSDSQWPHEQHQSGNRGDVGVGDVNFGTGSFNPSVNVNNTYHPGYLPGFELPFVNKPNYG